MAYNILRVVVLLYGVHIHAIHSTHTRTYPGAPPSTPLTDEDTALLLKYLNPTYLSEDAWKSIAERFQEDGSVQLRGFLRKGIADMVREGVRVGV